MQIDTTGFNLQKRTMSESDLSNRPVFVQGPFGDQSPFPNYEYSGDAPARLNRTVDLLLEGPNSRQNFINLFYCLPEIFAPVHEIASRVADAVWELRRTRDDQVMTDDINFNRLFTSPNPLMSHKQLTYQAVCYELLTGQNLEYFNIPGAMPVNYENIVTWTNIPTQRCTVKKKTGVDPYSATDISDFVEYYETTNGRRFDPAKVLNITNHDLISGNSIDGFVSPLIGAKLAIRNLLPVYEARGVIFIKRGALGFVTSKKSDESGLISLTPKEKDEAQQEFQSSYGLTGNKQLINVTSAPVEFVRTAMSIKELQPFDETLIDALAIYGVLRVPRHLCPTKEQSTFANADADMKSFYGDTIIPTANKYADKWTTAFKIPNRYIYPNFSKVAILQEDQKEKAGVDQINGNVFLQRFTSGVCTLNDWIVSTGEEAVTGNDLYTKRIFEMNEEQQTQVIKIINLKAQSSGTPASRETTEKPIIE